MVDEADGYTRRCADAPHGYSIMTVLLEATKGRLNERLAAHGRGLAMKFGTRPLRRHAIAFLNSLYHISIAGRALLYVCTDPVCDVAPDVEIPILHGRKVSVLVDACADALLHRLAYRPILPVHQIPEIHRIRRVEAGFFHLMAFKQEMAGDIGALRGARQENERRNVVARHAQEHVGIGEFSLVPHLFVIVQTGEGAPDGGSARGERIRSFAVRNAAGPVQIGAAGFTEGRHDCAQFRMYAAAVIALVVVFTEDLPIRVNLVADRRADRS